MSWEPLVAVAASCSKRNPCPLNGIRFSAQSIGKLGARLIRVQIGSELAKKLGMRAVEVPLSMQIDPAERKMKLQPCIGHGNSFRVRRQDNGTYRFTVNGASAAGKLSLEFPAISIESPEVISQGGNVPPYVWFTLPATFWSTEK